MTDDEPKSRPWTSRERGLLAWYRQARAQNRFPAETFKIAPFMIVVVPERFYDMLDYEAERNQAETFRAIRNAFKYDLENLHQYVEGKEVVDEKVPDLFADVAAGDAEPEVPATVQGVPVLFE
jgi:hypothetical protein